MAKFVYHVFPDAPKGFTAILDAFIKLLQLEHAKQSLRCHIASWHGHGAGKVA